MSRWRLVGPHVAGMIGNLGEGIVTVVPPFSWKELAMLVLSRKEGERLVIGDDVVVTVNRISGNRITLGIQAPRHVRIVRGELEPKEFAPAKKADSQVVAESELTYLEVDASLFENAPLQSVGH